MRLSAVLSVVQAEDMFRNPRKAYESALKKHGPVIGVYRKGRVNALLTDLHFVSLTVL